jgi:hypothetical protein
LIFTTQNAGSAANVLLDGCNLSAVTGTTFIALASTAIGSNFYFRNCRMPTSYALTSGSFQMYQSPNIYFENTDSSNTNYRNESYRYQGTITTNIVNTRMGGASNGTTGFS